MCQKSKTRVRDTSEHRQPPEDDEFFLYDGSDFYYQIEKLVDTPTLPMQKRVAFMKKAKIVMRKKLVKKLESHPRPENLDSLKVKKCNTEICSEMRLSKTRSKDLKTQKPQVCILKAVEVASNVTDTLINLKNSKILIPNNLRNSIGPAVHDCTGYLALRSHVNSSLENTSRDNITYCLDNTIP